MYRRFLLPAFFFFVMVDAAFGQSHLFYFEAQAVGGYSAGEEKWVTYSLNKDETMQKPSVGFDYVQKFSGETGDVATLAIQGRVAYSTLKDVNVEPQIYNAFLKFKTPVTDIWVGHSRPAFGLSSTFDDHGLLLQTLDMSGFGYDKDWGAGTYRELPWGNIAFSYTTGTGMTMRSEGNYLAAGRVSLGTLSQDNYNVGFSLSYGKTLDTMGYTIMEDIPKRWAMAGVDFTYLWDRFESRLDIMGGQNRGEDSYAISWRFGVNLLEEERLKLEVQPAFMRIAPEDRFQIAVGPSFAITADLALRGMYQYDKVYPGDDMEDPRADHRFIVQLYYYKKL
jgi:hypothetical protein